MCRSFPLFYKRSYRNEGSLAWNSDVDVDSIYARNDTS